MAKKTNKATLQAALSDLASLLENGELMASSFPAAFMKQAADEIRMLRDTLRKAVQENRRYYGTFCGAHGPHGICRLERHGADIVHLWRPWKDCL